LLLRDTDLDLPLLPPLVADLDLPLLSPLVADFDLVLGFDLDLVLRVLGFRDLERDTDLDRARGFVCRRVSIGMSGRPV
jgi:hypothetical protein